MIKLVRKSIPLEVKRILREEVGFGCPVKDCGNPYLEYHHFDPPVHERPHNEPEGMIALCTHHHKIADGGAFIIEQLHGLKADKTNACMVKGNLDWLRRDLLAVVGGCFYYETPRIIVVDGHELVSLKRDSDGYLRLSINMLSQASEERLIITENSWENIGVPIDLRSPPQGKELEVRYSNGDYLYLRFIELNSIDEACTRYKSKNFNSKKEIGFPITAVEINMTIGGTNIALSPESTTFAGTVVKGGLILRCGTGISINNTGVNWAQNPKWKLNRKVEHFYRSNVIKVDFKKQ
jgi:hypothetical protein